MAWAIAGLVLAVCIGIVLRGFAAALGVVLMNWRVILGAIAILAVIGTIGQMFGGKEAQAPLLTQTTAPAQPIDAGTFKIDSAKLAFGEFLIREGRNGVIPTLRLTVTNTYQYKTLDVSYAVCSLRGPVFFDEMRQAIGYDWGNPSSQHLIGERRLIAVFRAIAGTPEAADDAADHSPRVPPQTTKMVAYGGYAHGAFGSPDLILGNEDVEWCVTGASLDDVATKVHVTIDGGRVADPTRFQWLSKTPYGEQWLMVHSIAGM